MIAFSDMVFVCASAPTLPGRKFPETDGHTWGRAGGTGCMKLKNYLFLYYYKNDTFKFTQQAAFEISRLARNDILYCHSECSDSISRSPHKIAFLWGIRKNLKLYILNQTKHYFYTPTHTITFCGV